MDEKIHRTIYDIGRAFFILLGFSIIFIGYFVIQAPYSKVYDPHVDGFGWYLSGWNLYEGQATWKRGIKDSIFYGYIKDLDGETIKSVSIIQGYNPHGWGILHKEGIGEDKLLQEGIPRKLIVKIKRGDYHFHLDPKQTYANKCWVTIGIDMRFSLKGYDYNAPMGIGNSLVIGIPLFEVHLYPHGEEIKRINEVVLCTDSLSWGAGYENLFHYSKVKAILPKDEWINLNIDITDVIFEAQKAFGIQIDRQHQIQPFIETCGGSIEAWIDYIELDYPINPIPIYDNRYSRYCDLNIHNSVFWLFYFKKNR